jgi:hypothetical protein
MLNGASRVPRASAVNTAAFALKTSMQMSQWPLFVTSTAAPTPPIPPPPPPPPSAPQGLIQQLQQETQKKIAANEQNQRLKKELHDATSFMSAQILILQQELKNASQSQDTSLTLFWRTAREADAHF